MTTTVIFNAACPVCSREIAIYHRYCAAHGLPLRFADLTAGEAAAAGLSPDAAARRLHVLRDGEVLSGLPAFAALWAEMPRYRWLGRLVSLPLIRPVATLIYDRVLAPALYAMHKRRAARSAPPLCALGRDTDGPHG